MADDKKMAVASQLFKTGSDAVTKGNFDYAVDCFLKCVKLLPERLVYRQALRGAEMKHYNNNGKGAAMAKMKMMTAISRMQLNKSRKKWSEVMEAAEDALVYNPWDAKVLYDLAYAANQAQMLETATWLAENAASIDKESADLYRLLGDLYEQAKQFRKAMSAWELVRKLDPKDEDAQNKAHQLAAQDTIDKGKYENSESFKSKMSEQQRGVDGESGDTPEQRIKKEIHGLEATLAKEPTSINLLVQIGDLYRRLPDHDKAAECYQKGIDASGPAGNPDLKLKLLDCQIEPLKRNREIVDARRRSLERTDPDYAEKINKLNLQFTAFSIQILRKEVEFYRYKASLNNEDYNAQYEMGKRFLTMENFDDAIKSLQLGRQDLRNKWDALCMLGIAFWKKRNFVLAEKNLADALDAVPQMQEEGRKKVLYFRGRVAEDRGDPSRAAEFYNEIAAIDYGYKDVAKRLDGLNNAQSG